MAILGWDFRQAQLAEGGTSSMEGGGTGFNEILVQGLFLAGGQLRSLRESPFRGGSHISTDVDAPRGLQAALPGLEVPGFHKSQASTWHRIRPCTLEQ
jgi:hypothetical protein